jgi:hypothetical protein
LDVKDGLLVVCLIISIAGVLLEVNTGLMSRGCMALVASESSGVLFDYNSMI